jgi:WD40 repeat protein
LVEYGVAGFQTSIVPLAAAFLWDAATGRPLLKRATSAEIERVVFGPDSHHLATADVVDLITVWDLSIGRVQRAIHGRDTSPYCLAFSAPDGESLAFVDKQGTVGQGGEIRFWNWEKDKETHAWPLHLGGDSRIYDLMYSPDGRWLAAAVAEKSLPAQVRVWDTVTGQVWRQLQGHTGVVRALAFSPDSHRLASASDDHTIRVWDIATGGPFLDLRGHCEPVFGIAYSPDGRRLVSASGDGTLKVWDAASLPDPIPLRGHSGIVWSVAYSPDGRRLVSAGEDQTVRVWDADGAREILTLRGFRDTVVSAAFSPTGLQVAAGCGDGSAQLWDAISGHQVFTFSGLPGGTTASGLAFSPRGDKLAIASSDARGAGSNPSGAGSEVSVWDTAIGQKTMSVRDPERIYAIAFSPDGRILATAGSTKTIDLWDAATSGHLLSLRGHKDPVWALAFQPGGAWLASGDEGGIVNVWDVGTALRHAPGAPVLSLHGHTGRILRLAFSQDGMRLASASGGYNQGVASLPGEVILWDMGTGEQTLRLGGFRGWVNCVAFSPDGLHMATATGDEDPNGKLAIWDAIEVTSAARQHGDARSLVSFLFSQRLSRAEVLKRVRADQTISDGVRQVALAAAEQYPGDPLGFDDVRRVVSQTGLSSRTYFLAFAQARTASGYDPKNGLYLATVGMAQYRRGGDSCQAALEALARADQLDAQQHRDPPPINLAFEAMAAFKLGHRDAARTFLRRCRDLLQRSEWKNEPPSHQIFREAEALLSGPHRPG